MWVIVRVEDKVIQKREAQTLPFIGYPLNNKTAVIPESRSENMLPEVFLSVKRA